MNRNSIILLKLIILIFLLHGITFAQQKDSLFILSDPVVNTIDSLFVSSDVINNPVDSLFNAIPKGKSYDVDTTVFASSKDSLIFLVKDKKMNIYGEGNINYKSTEIKSANIFIDFKSNNINANGVPSDTLTGKFDGTPVLKEGTEVYEGQTMKYNFKSGQGLLSFVKT